MVNGEWKMLGADVVGAAATKTLECGDLSPLSFSYALKPHPSSQTTPALPVSSIQYRASLSTTTASQSGNPQK
jgi:hypothetical protein